MHPILADISRQTILIIVVLVILFGGGGYWWYGRGVNGSSSFPAWGGPSLGFILIVLLILYLLGVI